MTKNQIMEQLDALGVKYNKKDTKNDLEKLLLKNEPKAEAEADEEPKEVSPKVVAKTKDVALATKAKLEQEEKINFYLPLAEGEKAGAAETVTINGYRTVVKKGVMQQLPKSIVNILAEHLKISAEAGKEMLVERNEATLEALSE